MAKRNSVNDRQKKAVRPVDAMLFNTNIQTNKQENIQTDKQDDIQLSIHENLQTNILDDKQINTHENNKTSKHTNKRTSKHVNIQTELKRQTYYLSPELIKALKFYCAFEDTDKSEVVRKALQKFIPKKYFDIN